MLRNKLLPPMWHQLLYQLQTVYGVLWVRQCNVLGVPRKLHVAVRYVFALLLRRMRRDDQELQLPRMRASVLRPVRRSHVQHVSILRRPVLCAPDLHWPRVLAVRHVSLQGLLSSDGRQALDRLRRADAA